MASLLSPLTRLADSITGRTFLILSIGVTTAAVLSLALAVHARSLEFDAMREGEVVARAQDLKARWEAVGRGDASPASLQAVLGVRFLERAPPFEPDLSMEKHLAGALGAATEPQAGLIDVASCLPDDVSTRALAAPGPGGFAMRMDCWLVSFRALDGARVTAAMVAPPFVSSVGSAMSPLFLLALLIASGLMSLLVARLVTRPLRRLSDAAAALSVSLDAPATAVKGPSEVRAALSTFNLMQSRVRQGLVSRTQLLASISHDLQTPLTRLRLRVEHIEDADLRAKLVGDIQVMQRLVREGLDLARSHESQEPWSMVDIDSLIGSLAEDAVEVGADVTVKSGCGAAIALRPDALSRVLTNLIDNAVKYGGSAEIDCKLDPEAVVISIRDHGPGLPDPDDPRLFEPFFRAGAALRAQGHGVGLTIARAQAELTAGSVRLTNHPHGGLIAWVRLERRTSLPG